MAPRVVGTYWRVANGSIEGTFGPELMSQLGFRIIRYEFSTDPAALTRHLMALRGPLNDAASQEGSARRGGGEH